MLSKHWKTKTNIYHCKAKELEMFLFQTHLTTRNMTGHVMRIALPFKHYVNLSSSNMGSFGKYSNFLILVLWICKLGIHNRFIRASVVRDSLKPQYSAYSVRPNHSGLTDLGKALLCCFILSFYINRTSTEWFQIALTIKIYW